MKTNTQNNKGFTLIELIMVTIILGILAAVAIPRYTATVERAEAAAEDAVISSIRAGLETYATESLMEHGLRSWPTDPFDALETEPTGYSSTNGDALVDGEWTYNLNLTRITHMRGDNSVETWNYDKGNQAANSSQAVGSLGARN
jgi:prepilin-type N-terminal cleavage/methylation domain-containing protein